MIFLLLLLVDHALAKALPAMLMAFGVAERDRLDGNNLAGGNLRYLSHQCDISRQEGPEFEVPEMLEVVGLCYEVQADIFFLGTTVVGARTLPIDGQYPHQFLKQTCCQKIHRCFTVCFGRGLVQIFPTEIRNAVRVSPFLYVVFKMAISTNS